MEQQLLMEDDGPPVSPRRVVAPHTEPQPIEKSPPSRERDQSRFSPAISPRESRERPEQKRDREQFQPKRLDLKINLREAAESGAPKSPRDSPRQHSPRVREPLNESPRQRLQELDQTSPRVKISRENPVQQKERLKLREVVLSSNHERAVSMGEDQGSMSPRERERMMSSEKPEHAKTREQQAWVTIRVDPNRSSSEVGEQAQNSPRGSSNSSSNHNSARSSLPYDKLSLDFVKDKESISPRPTGSPRALIQSNLDSPRSPRLDGTKEEKITLLQKSVLGALLRIITLIPPLKAEAIEIVAGILSFLLSFFYFRILLTMLMS
jgi:hypothetical protein